MIISRLFYLSTVFCIVTALTSCHEEPLRINHELGIFPDSVMALEGLNTEYDDYNIDIEAGCIESSRQVVFSSSRGSAGGEFNIVQGKDLVPVRTDDRLLSFRFRDDLRYFPG